ncbi:hypothetical protein DYB32_001760 [Aphanomyces invadans]|uniref:EF-hand domain-containing protein n=1 Tax=Aphanomyces invadans TaxID=157072 RepID=A0A418B5E2_9STRA|nr:hypothetical protein DYB32_001760 [Aphanomyces invadans]
MTLRTSVNSVGKQAKRDAVNHTTLASGKRNAKKGNLKPLHKEPSTPSKETIGNNEDGASEIVNTAAGPPVDPRFVDEERILAEVFRLVDSDRGGTLDKNEMVWALTKDAYVRNVAMTSVVLKDVLKKRSVDGVFAEIDHDNSNSISWDRFATYCHDKFDGIMADRDRKILENGGVVEKIQTKDDIIRRKNEAYAARKAILEQEAAIAKAFGKAFVGMATDDADGMSLDEFLAFCTEIASVAMLNDLAAP